MELVTKSYGSSVDVFVKGIIKTIANAQEIKDTLQMAYRQSPDIHLNLIIEDSFIITSSVIGFLIKTIKADHRSLHVKVNSAELYEMLEDMNLIEMMNVTKVA